MTKMQNSALSEFRQNSALSEFGKMDAQQEPPDRVDAELVEDALRMPGYELIAKRMRDEIARRTRALIDTGENADYSRGMIKGLELALQIPKIIMGEGRKEKPKR